MTFTAGFWDIVKRRVTEMFLTSNSNHNGHQISFPTCFIFIEPCLNEPFACAKHLKIE